MEKAARFSVRRPLKRSKKKNRLALCFPTCARAQRRRQVLSACSGLKEATLSPSLCKVGHFQFKFDTMTFKYVVEGWLMPSVSLFGLAGNALSMYILHHREVKLKKDFVDVLCMLATFDNLLLLAAFFLFSLPTLSESYLQTVSPKIQYC